jgi:hypothetical protein
MDSSQRVHEDRHGAYHRESQENWAQSPIDSSFCKWLKPRRHVPKASVSQELLTSAAADYADSGYEHSAMCLDAPRVRCSLTCPAQEGMSSWAKISKSHGPTYSGYGVVICRRARLNGVRVHDRHSFAGVGSSARLWIANRREPSAPTRRHHRAVSALWHRRPHRQLTKVLLVMVRLSLI